MRYEWVAPLLPKLRDVDVTRLGSGTKARAAAAAEADARAAAAGAGGGGGAAAEAAAEPGPAKLAKRANDKTVDAARQRYLQRKAQAAAAGKK